MKFSQLILIILIINISNVMLGFSMQSQDISTLEDTLINWFNDDTNGFVNTIDTFSDNVRKENNWILKKIGDIAQGFTNAVNVVTIGFQIITLVLWGWITPTMKTIESNLVQGVSILRLLGMIGLMYIQWWNIMLIIKLYKFIKGSDQ